MWKSYHDKETPAGNSTFAIGGVSCSADSFVVTESSVLRINICTKNPTHRQAENRYVQAKQTTSEQQESINRKNSKFIIMANSPQLEIWQEIKK